MAKAGCSIADIAAGMYAYSAILAAIVGRSKTGEGSKIDISMLESLVEWMGYPMYYAFEGAEPPPRAGASHATIYPYGPFPAKDGKSVMLGLQNEREWVSFCENILVMPELAQDSRFESNSKRSENRGDLQDIVWGVFSKLDADQILKKLDHAGIANAHVNEMSDVWAHPQLQARNRWVDVESSGGDIPALLPPSNNSSFLPTMGKVPDLGEHSVSILEGLGYEPREIENLINRKVI
jgi:itaconate CoA-transferase